MRLSLFLEAAITNRLFLPLDIYQPTVSYIIWPKRNIYFNTVDIPLESRIPSSPTISSGKAGVCGSDNDTVIRVGTPSHQRAQITFLQAQGHLPAPRLCLVWTRLAQSLFDDLLLKTIAACCCSHCQNETILLTDHFKLFGHQRDRQGERKCIKQDQNNLCPYITQDDSVNSYMCVTEKHLHSLDGTQ